MKVVIADTRIAILPKLVNVNNIKIRNRLKNPDIRYAIAFFYFKRKLLISNY